MSALDRLAEIEARLNHEPCCGCAAAEYGNCSDCRNTGCAHAPYIDNDHALADMAALTAALWAVLGVADEAQATRDASLSRTFGNWRVPALVSVTQVRTAITEALA